MFRVVCLLSLVLTANTASAPFIKPCKADDSACIVSSAAVAIPYFASGVPELGIKPMDPLKLSLIKSDQGGLKMTFKESTLTGLKDCNVENIKHDSSKMRQTVVLKCNLALTGDYDINGQLLILSTQGNGKYKIDIRDLVIKTIVDLTTVTGEDGKSHWHIKKWSRSFKVLTGTTFHFENLFNGNKVLAEPVLEFANTNWKDVMQEIAPPVIDAVVAEVVSAVEALYKSVPLDEIHS
ncbi:unnamed protein product [Euphydryas editha]|uniref:Uncharacterized protein n=1 Tax=Euphydryas editha TaxID=104508 RepID=A0AAU9TE63_EUPED|nr:unnamed protein product [Euphydryas editha]